MVNNVVHKKKTEECQICGKVVQRMDLHMKVHSEFKPFKCELCNKAFTYSSRLSNHIRTTHTGTKPFKCKLCDKRFSQLSNLSSHMQTHAGSRQKSFKCEICGRRCT